MIRHGPTDSLDRLNGRTDVGLAVRPDAVALQVAALRVSPARRARDTAAGLFPGLTAFEDPRLWEQDFGVWEGRPYAELPDVGALSKAELAELKADGGESFHDLAARAKPAIVEAAELAMVTDKPVALVAHAGIVRVALSLALESASAALAFQIDHFGATRLSCFEGGFAVTAVNERLA